MAVVVGICSLSLLSAPLFIAWPLTLAFVTLLFSTYVIVLIRSRIKFSRRFFILFGIVFVMALAILMVRLIGYLTCLGAPGVTYSCTNTTFLDSWRLGTLLIAPMTLLSIASLVKKGFKA